MVLFPTLARIFNSESGVSIVQLVKQKKMTKILITGGAGYVGAVLTPYLLNKGYKITVLDLMIYGETVLKKNLNLKIIKGDIRDTELLSRELPGHEAVIHLACISNDPSFELNPELGKSINLDAFVPLVEIAKKNLVKKFIYASTSSVYGIKKEKDVVGLAELAKEMSIPIQYFEKEDLASIATPNPSKTVQTFEGTPSVSEAAAIRSSEGKLVVEKQKFPPNLTIAIARIPN